ncbi:Zn-dependent hydrolase [Paenibacillus sp. NPDC058071]|uniref:Zn-dependent hydrolase n=1 Tax=Paenibacillus sp. NPDC058071 TaxID=3346326 RepID=UPI0036DC6BCE
MVKPSASASVTIDGQRLWRTLVELSRYGAGAEGTGITRLSLSEAEVEARESIVRLMKEAGLTVWVDAAGNLIGRLEAFEGGGNGADEAPHLEAYAAKRDGAVVTGSHIDTVVQAGMFDGALGVLAGIEALRTIREHAIPHARPLEVVCFTDEEGVRFGAGYFGSRAMAGGWNGEWLELRDAEGITLRAAMERAGLDPSRCAGAARTRESVHAYVELHIEQGRVLEELGAPVGTATAIYGHRWLEASLKGHADHAGTTPMALRRDAAMAAAESMLAIERIALAEGGVAAVGAMRLGPGAINVIPGESVFTVDLRHERQESLDAMAVAVQDAIVRTADSRGVSAEIRVIDGAQPVPTSPRIHALIADSCAEIGLQANPLICGAGHDAVVMSELAEIGLILVRSKDGLSHHPMEWSSPEDCEAGANVLLHTLLKLANE